MACSAPFCSECFFTSFDSSAWMVCRGKGRENEKCVGGWGVIFRLMKLLLTAAHQHIWAARKWLNMTMLSEIEWKPNKRQDINQFKIKTTFTCFLISAAMPQKTKAEVKASYTKETCLYMGHTHLYDQFSLVWPQNQDPGYSQWLQAIYENAISGGKKKNKKKLF